MRNHILIADDEPALLYAVTYVLRKNGFKVSQAKNGREALSLILERQKNGEQFDLLLTDIQMPEMSGIELIAELRKRETCLPILALSGSLDFDLTRKLLQEGCSDFLSKPFGLLELLHRVKTLLGQRQKDSGGERLFTAFGEEVPAACPPPGTLDSHPFC